MTEVGGATDIRIEFTAGVIHLLRAAIALLLPITFLLVWVWKIRSLNAAAVWGVEFIVYHIVAGIAGYYWIKFYTIPAITTLRFRRIILYSDLEFVMLRGKEHKITDIRIVSNIGGFFACISYQGGALSIFDRFYSNGESLIAQMRGAGRR